MRTKNYFLKLIIFFIVTATKSELSYREDEINLSLVECLVEIIKSNEAGYLKMTIFNSAKYFTSTSEILRSTSTPVTINAYESHHWTGTDTRTPTDLVVVLDETLEPFDIINNTLWFSDTKFFIVSENADKLNSIFETFWVSQIINVFTLVLTNTDVSLYTFTPFKPGNCKEVKNKFIEKWNGKFSENHLSFIKNGRTDITFNECPVNISVVNTKPNTMFHDDCDCLKLKTSKCEKFDYRNNKLSAPCIDGIEGKIILEVGKKLNYSATYVIPEDLNAWGWVQPKPGGVAGHVYLGLSVIGFGLLHSTVERFEYLDLTVPYDGNECVTFGVPKGAGPKRPSWLDLLTAEFPIETWIALSISFIVVCIFLRNLNNDIRRKLHTNSVTFYITALALQITSKQPKGSVLRILILTWCWGTFILTIVYQTSMGSSLTVPKPDPDINTFKELLALNLKITGYKQVLHMLRFADDEEDFQRLADRFILNDDELEVVVDKMASERDFANARHSTTLKYYSLILPKARGEVRMMAECIYFFSPTFVLKKRSPFTKMVNKIVTNLKEMGITQYWRSLYIRKTPKVPQDFIKLSLNHVKGLFLIILIGYALAVVCFALEILFSKFGNKNRV